MVCGGFASVFARLRAFAAHSPAKSKGAIAHGCVVLTLLATSMASARVDNPGEFAPGEAWTRPAERPFRDDLCLNGAWQFQPVPVAADLAGHQGDPPPLAPPGGEWEAAPVKVPSPWNANAWGTGPDAGPGTGHPYWPTSVYFPSYPPRWTGVEQGWLRRTFRVPAGWAGRRVAVHFEAVAGACVVLVNGRPAGTHFDTYTPFELDVTDLLRPGENELRVGVQSHHLFDRRSDRYPKMRAPYPVGSNTERLCGIWQDVFLLAVPPVRVADAFVQPNVDRGELAVDVTVRNDTGGPATVRVGGAVRPWARDGGDNGQTRSHLDPAVLSLPPADVTIAAGRTAVVTLRQPVGSALKRWAPGSPNLYAAVVSVDQNGTTVDRQQTRFGWRQFTLSGPNLLLNGQKIQLAGDLLHPFGPFTLSRRYAWGWYKLVQDFGGNAVRLHAQPMPRFYLDLADEMGLCVLDETALFGSSVALDFEPPEAWRRFADHYDGLVLRDRNHPAVMGWSFGNELFAIFDLNHVAPADADRWYRQLGDLGLRARALDPTRPWISCDGDGDLRGTLPVYAKHFGLGLPAADRLPADGLKPLMVGESGGSYYARPEQLAVFNGPAAFASYAGRNDALGIDAYDNLVHLAKPRLAYYSASETAWFGVEPLPFGYADVTRLPTAADGVFFTAPFVDGKPGIQLEHLPPYVATINPGWDPDLPLYRPLGMFKAERAALDPAGPQPCPWDHRDVPPPPAAARPPTTDRVAFIGDRDGPLGRRLLDWGVPLVPDGNAADLVIVDAGAKPPEFTQTPRDGVLILLGDTAPDWAKVVLTDRPATALVNDPGHAFTSTFRPASVYFAEGSPDQRAILRHGMDGPALRNARVLLRASDTDWSLFNDQPEVAKCGAEVLYEHLAKPSGVALIGVAPGTYVCSLDYRLAAPAADAMWRQLFTNMGVKLGAARPSAAAAFDDGGALATACVAGRFPADAPLPDRPRWTLPRYVDRDRFLLDRFDPGGQAVPFAVYFSYWVKSPRALDDLLAGGPDVPRYDTVCYAADGCELSLNGRVIAPARSEPADYRTRVDYPALPLRKGWNHVLIRVTAARLTAGQPPTLAVRARSDDAKFFAAVETSAGPPAGERSTP